MEPILAFVIPLVIGMLGTYTTLSITYDRVSKKREKITKQIGLMR